MTLIIVQVSVVKVNVYGVESMVQVSGKVINVKSIVENLGLTECGNMNVDKFQALFITSEFRQLFCFPIVSQIPGPLHHLFVSQIPGPLHHS